MAISNIAYMEIGAQKVEEKEIFSIFNLLEHHQSVNNNQGQQIEAPKALSSLSILGGHMKAKMGQCMHNT